MAIVKQQEADKRPVAKNSFTMACHTGEHFLELKENLYNWHRKLLKKSCWTYGHHKIFQAEFTLVLMETSCEHLRLSLSRTFPNWCSSILTSEETRVY